MSLLFLGLVTIDIHQVVSTFPGPNQKVAATGSTVDFGGPAANAAAAAQALGSETALHAALGHGPLAGTVQGLVNAAGVEFTALTPEAGETPFAVPISAAVTTSTTGDRAVISSHRLMPRDVTWNCGSWTEDISAVLVDGHYLPAAIQVAQFATQKAVPVILDGGSWKPGLEELLPFISVAIVSADFQAPLRFETGLHSVPFLARTGGESPILLSDLEGNSARIKVPEVHVADTLGAGDVLHGAFMHYLETKILEGTTSFEAVAQSLQAAAQVASYSCSFRGARGWVESFRSDQWSS